MFSAAGWLKRYSQVASATEQPRGSSLFVRSDTIHSAGLDTDLSHLSWPTDICSHSVFVGVLMGIADRELTILVADDHPFVRDGLAMALRRLEKNCRITEVGTAQQAHDCAKNADVIFYDLNLSGPAPYNSLGRLCKSTHARVVVISGETNPDDIRIAFSHGAVSFIPKNLEANVLYDALRLILDGGTYVPIEALHSGPANSIEESPETELTTKQLEILRLIVGGKLNKEIANELGLSIATVKLHINTILRTLRVTNRTEAAGVARERRII